jgi:hypothetical protein
LTTSLPNLTKHGKEEFKAYRCDVCAGKGGTGCGVYRAEFVKREDTLVRRIFQWLQGAVSYLQSLPVGILKLENEAMEGGEKSMLTPAQKEMKRQREKKRRRAAAAARTEEEATSDT